MLSPRPRLCAASLATLVLAGGATPARAEESARGQVQLGPDIGLAQRPATPNPGGVHYGAALAYGAHVQMLAAKWMRVSAYWLRSSHALTLPAGALGTGAPLAVSGSLSTYVIGIRFQPTWNVTDRLHIWGNVGAGWGKLQAPAVEVQAASPYTIAPREGVMVELPFGVGGGFDVIPRWLGATLDLVVGPTTSQSGEIFDRTQAIDAAGKMVHPGGMPATSRSFVALIGATLEL